MDSIASLIRRLGQDPAEDTDPNKDPQDLFRQVQPLLEQMNIHNLADRGKTELIPDQTKANLQLYCITLRRGSKITSDQIDRIKRNEKNFSYIEWTAQAMKVYVWYKYATPAARVKTPAAPGNPAQP
jgi:hypothetical protein